MSRIDLERVVFRDGVQMPSHIPTEPGRAPAMGPTEKIVGCYPSPRGMMAKEPYNLWFDTESGTVWVEHPKSGERQEVPFANVVQWKRKSMPTAKAGKG